MQSLIERFIKYVKIETRSDPGTHTHPSTPSQHRFARELVEELKQLGLTDAEVDEHSYVMARLPANLPGNAPVIGFISHLDTSPDMTGENVNPKIVRNYDGGDIVLDPQKNIVLSPSEFPDLKGLKGNDLIVTDGRTLLGADDKAGIAEIMTALEYLIAHPEIKHGTIRVCFTPDEEIGEGADHFDTAKFGADFAYTMDGDRLGTLEYENFNAASADVEIKGRNIHPGSAKNKMMNSILIASEFNTMLPPWETPAHTEGYEGFYHLNEIHGNVENTQMHYLLRDHDRGRFEEKKRKMESIARYLNEKYGSGTVNLTLKDQYYNMREKIEPVMHVVELAEKAMAEVGVTPVIKPIRGGTDGSRLSYMGLPTPNLFTGGSNFHGRYEYIPVQSMQKAVEVIIKLVQLAAGQS